jgi:hypothetical protein
MEAADSSRTLVNIYQIVLYHMLKDYSFHIHYHENPKSHVAGVTVLYCKNAEYKELWGPPTVKQALPKQHSPQQLQRPLDSAPPSDKSIQMWASNTLASIHEAAGSNTSTMTLRVVWSDKKGSLKSEAVKYGQESQGTGTRERLHWQGPTAYTKDRPVLSSERAPHKKQDCNCQTVINIWLGLDTKTYWLTVSHNVTLTLTLASVTAMLTSREHRNCEHRHPADLQSPGCCKEEGRQ